MTGPGTDDALVAQAVEAVPPLLRGWMHLVCFVLSLPAGVLLAGSAGSPRARVATIVYCVALSALFGVSATYHRGRWTGAARARMRRLDHGTIFVMIAGSYTPFCLLALRGAVGTAVLTAVWVGAGVGLVFAVTGIAERPVVGLACYVGLGWGIVGAFPQLMHHLSAGQLTLLVTGGVLYTVGGVFLATCWPNPFPRVFGYHEVWHLMVAAACLCHYTTILSLVRD